MIIKTRNIIGILFTAMAIGLFSCRDNTTDLIDQGAISYFEYIYDQDSSIVKCIVTQLRSNNPDEPVYTDTTRTEIYYHYDSIKNLIKTESYSESIVSDTFEISKVEIVAPRTVYAYQFIVGQPQDTTSITVLHVNDDKKALEHDVTIYNSSTREITTHQNIKYTYNSQGKLAKMVNVINDSVETYIYKPTQAGDTLLTHVYINGVYNGLQKEYKDQNSVEVQTNYSISLNENDTLWKYPDKTISVSHRRFGLNYTYIYTEYNSRQRIVYQKLRSIIDLSS